MDAPLTESSRFSVSHRLITAFSAFLSPNSRFLLVASFPSFGPGFSFPYAASGCPKIFPNWDFVTACDFTYRERTFENSNEERCWGSAASRWPSTARNPEATRGARFGEAGAGEIRARVSAYRV